MNEEILEEIKNYLINFDIDNLKKKCKEAIDKGISPLKIINSLSKGMDIVGKKYEEGEFFLSDLIMAGETMKEAMEVIKPYLKESEIKKIGKVVIGTVRGDLHDIGKNIVATLLTAAGFDVIDLGIDVPPEKFIEAVREYKPNILGMSALLTTTMIEMENVIKELEKSSLRKSVKVIVGGAPLNEEFSRKI
ncbi:MAG: corrinoid protein, partial [Nitrososphaerota archaeon]